MSAGRPAVCPRCSDGLPTCTDVKPDGQPYSHAETCATRTWSTELCNDCQEAA